MENRISSEHKAISALKWATAAKLVVQLVSWAGTLVIIRLLTAEDYGLMAKVTVVCAIAGAIAELGLGAAIVRSVDMAREDLRKIYGMSLLLGAIMTIALVVAAPFIAHLFQEPRLTWPIAGASLQILVGAVAIVPNALWTRDLSFRRLSQIEMISGFTSIIATLLLALFGAGVWALVLGTLFGAILRSAALLKFGQTVRPLFSMHGISEHLKFGLTLVGGRVTSFVVLQSDIIIGSAFLSTTEIGQYSVALQLATLPMTKVMGTINQIALPAVAQQQSNPAYVRQKTLQATGFISLLAFPALWGVSAVAPELVHVLLGPKWLQAVPALTILPIIVPVRMVCSVLFTISLALGNRQLELRNTFITFALIPSGFFIGAHWGLVGLSSAWLVSLPIAYACIVPSILRFMDISPLKFIAECGPPAAAAAVMYAVIAALRPALAEQPVTLTLGTLIAAGVLVYCVVIALISRRHLITARSFARSLLARGAPKNTE